MPTAEPASLTRALAAREREAAAGMLGDLVSIASVTGTPAETRA